MARLRPLTVPWKISPSNPSLALATKAFDGINHGYVTFMGLLGEATKLVSKYGAYQQIAVTFDRIVYARLYPEFSPDDVERLDSYDWDMVLKFQDKEHGFRDHYRTFHDQWNATNICPDPAAYIVEKSDLVQRLGIEDAAFQHYLFVGDDYNVEVIAQSLTWQVVAHSPDSEKATLA